MEESRGQQTLILPLPHISFQPAYSVLLCGCSRPPSPVVQSDYALFTPILQS